MWVRDEASVGFAELLAWAGEEQILLTLGRLRGEVLGLLGIADLSLGEQVGIRLDREICTVN